LYMNGRDCLYCISVEACDWGASVMGIHSMRHAKTNSVPILTVQFPQKSPIINGSFSEKSLQLEACYALLPSCMRHRTCMLWSMRQRVRTRVRERKKKSHTLRGNEEEVSG